MDAIRSWWEVPCIAHFCHVFKKPLKLPTFDIEELEDAILLDHSPSPSPLLVELHCNLLNGIVDRDISEENWPFFLKLHLEWRCEYLSERWNPLAGDKEYKDLVSRDKVEILHRLCNWRLELDDIGELLRGMDGPSLRLDPLGRDSDGFSYWYFYGTRLYKETPKKPKQRRKKKEEATPAGKKNTGTPGSSKRGRGRGGTPRGRVTPGRRRKQQQEEEEAAEEGEGGSGSESETPARKGKRKGVNGMSGDSPRPGRGRGRGRVRGRRVKEGEEVEEGEGEEGGDERSDVEDESPLKSHSRGPVKKEEPPEAENGEKMEEGGTKEEEEEKAVVMEDREKEEDKSPPCPDTGWTVVCDTLEDWEELVETLHGIKHTETRRLWRYLSDELLPEMIRLFQIRDRQYKQRLLAELPRRTSDRIALKAIQKAEQERMDALEREMQRVELRKIEAEEQRQKEDEAEERRQRKREEALQRKKVREEEQRKLRMEEEENWTRAMSGELSGRRKAALEHGEGEPLPEAWQLMVDKEEELRTAMFKILTALRRLEDGWVFEDPVTESIAPGYFDVVEKPMDYSTVEKKLENKDYHTQEEFEKDIILIYDNCMEYNGDESEYAELAAENKKTFQQLCQRHFSGEEPEEEEGKGKNKKRNRDSRSPSACHTPELTSESSEEEEESEGSDDSYVGPGQQKKPKALKLPRLPGLQKNGEKPSMIGPMRLLPPGARPPPGMIPPNVPPQYYHQYMQQMAMRGHMQGYPRMPPPYPGGPPGHPPHPSQPPPHPSRPPMRAPPDMYPPYPPHPSQPPGHYPPPHMHPYNHPMAQMYPPHHHPPHPHSPHPHSPHPHPSYPHPPHPRTPSHPPPGMLPRQSSSPALGHGSPRSLSRQSSSPALSQQLTASPAGSPALNGPLVVGAEKEGNAEPTKPPATEGGKGEEQKIGADGKEEPKTKEVGEGTGEERKTEDGGTGREEERRAAHLPREPPPGQHPTMAYEMGRQAAYKYQQHHQQMMAHHGQLPYPEGYPPSGYDQAPPYPAHKRDEAYYAWQQQQQQAMYGGRPDVAGPYPPPSPMEMARQQRYWQEMEMRRRQQYHAMMQHRMHQMKKHQQQQQQKAQGEAPPQSSGTQTSGSGKEDIPDYTNSLRKYAMSLGSSEGGEVKGEVEEEAQGEKSEEGKGKEGKAMGKKIEEGEEGEKEGEGEKNEEKGTGKEEGEEKPSKGDKGEEERENEDKTPPKGKSAIDVKKPDMKEGDGEAEKPDKASTSAHPSRSHLQPGRPYPAHPYPPHPSHMSPYQNGYPSDMEMVRMQHHYYPQPAQPHMLPPGHAPPPYSPSPGADHYNNGMGHRQHPGYGYYGNRASYYPPSYMHDPSGMSPEQAERWRMEAMKRQQAMQAMHPYPPHQHPHHPPSRPHPTHPPPHTPSQAQSSPKKHNLESSLIPSEEPPPKKARTS